MFKNRRTAVAVRSIGVASAAAALALGVAGNAFACKPGDFTTSSVTCDKDTGKGTVSVHDTDSVRPVLLTVKDNSGASVANGTWSDRDENFTLTVPWTQGAQYTVYATVTGRFADEKIGDVVTIPNETCGKTETSPSPSPSASTTATPTPSTGGGVATPSATTSSPAAAVADTNAPKPAGGTSDLAETGGGSNTGMIAGIAAALVVAGGGTVFMLRRRKPAAHN